MSLVTLSIESHQETWPLKNVFRISRGERTEAQVVVVTISDGLHTGRGEAVPIRRYNQSTVSVLAQVESIRSEQSLDRHKLQNLLLAGAARNALDCAFWDLEAKKTGKRVWDLAKVLMRPEVETSFTISLDTPENMAAAAKPNASAPILKLKLNGDDLDFARVKAVRSVAPGSRLLIDANESWSPSHYQKIVPTLKDLRIEIIEQPFPASADEILQNLDHPIPICADESCHIGADVPRLTNRYEMVNVKLDKAGGLTEALHLCERAREAGFKLLIGCMVGTSLSMAPARVLAGIADYVDLDGPLLLARDRDHGLNYHDGKIDLPARDFWG